MNQPQSPNPAEIYQRYFVPAMFQQWAAILLRCAAPKPGARVLDVACGTGVVAREAAAHVGDSGQVTALDVSPAMLAVARSLPAPSGAKITWKEGNAMALPFPDRALDLVLCQHGLQFFPDRAGAVREMRRVLAPGGRVAVMVLQALERHPVFAALGQSLARYLNLTISEVMTPFAMSNAGELRRLFADAGFSNVAVQPESALMRFAEPERFAPLAIVSAAAAVPAFAKLDGAARADMIATVSRDIAPTVEQHRESDAIAFQMFAHVALATA